MENALNKTEKEETRVCKCCGKELPIFAFKANSRYGRTSVCADCMKKKREENGLKKTEMLREQLDAARKTRLSEFLPRELLEELKRRGYRWDKMWVTVVQEVDYNKI